MGDDSRPAWPKGVTIHSGIYRTYAMHGGLDSPLGLPTSDEQKDEEGTFTQFERGRIYWTAKRRQQR